MAKRKDRVVDKPVVVKPQKIPANVQAFIDLSIEYMDDLLESSISSRNSNNGRNFQNRHRRNRDRAEVKVNPSLTVFGAVDSNKKDGHASVGMTQGWSARAQYTANTNLFAMIFRSGDRFYKPRGRGEKSENDKLEKILIHVGDLILREGRFIDRAGRDMCRLLPVDGTHWLEAAVSRRVDLIQDVETGLVTEEAGKVEVQFCNPCVDTVLVTDWGSAGREDQEGFFKITRRQTVRRLEPFERVVSRETISTPNGTDKNGKAKFKKTLVERTTGRYVNFQALREAEEKAMASKIVVNKGGDKNRESVSVYPVFDPKTYQGALPIIQWSKDKKFTPEIAKWFGIDLGFEPKGEAETRDWFRKLQRLDWNYTWISDTQLQQQTSDIEEVSPEDQIGNHLLEMSPRAPVDGSSDIYPLKYRAVSDEMLGLSIVDLGDQLETAADQARNNVIYIDDFNTDPPIIYDKKVMKSRSEDDLKNLFRKSGAIAVDNLRNLRIEDIYKLGKLEQDPVAEERIAIYQAQFEEMTGINQAAKGQSSADTATQAQIDERNTQGLLGDTAIAIALELCNMMKSVIMRVQNLLGPELFREFVTEAAGLEAVDYDTVENELVNGEFDMLPALTSGQDGVVVATSILRGVQAFGETVNLSQAAVRFFQELGISNAEDLVPSATETRDPEDENALIFAGTEIKVSQLDNHQIHIVEHEAAAKALADEAGGMDETERKKIIEILSVLALHVQKHRSFMQVQAEQQAMELAAQQQGGGTPGSGAGLELDTRPDAGSDLSGAVGRDGPGSNLERA